MVQGDVNCVPSRAAQRAMTPSPPVRRYQVLRGSGARVLWLFSESGLGPRLHTAHFTGAVELVWNQAPLVLALLGKSSGTHTRWLPPGVLFINSGPGAAYL